MADFLKRTLANLTADTPLKILEAPAASVLDKLVITNFGFCNKGPQQDEVYLYVVTAGGSPVTCYLLSGQPVGVKDSFWGKPDISFNLEAGDSLYVRATQPGQNVDVIINYLLSDLS